MYLKILTTTWFLVCWIQARLPLVFPLMLCPLNQPWQSCSSISEINFIYHKSSSIKAIPVFHHEVCWPWLFLVVLLQFSCPKHLQYWLKLQVQLHNLMSPALPWGLCYPSEPSHSLSGKPLSIIEHWTLTQEMGASNLFRYFLDFEGNNEVNICLLIVKMIWCPY